MFEIEDKVMLRDNKEAIIIGIEKEPISRNTVYLVDRKYVGKYDKEYGYNRQYYKKNTWFVYPSEILSKVD
jgi:hypothetical protein